MEIRSVCKAKEEKLKLQKDIANEAKKHEDLMRSRSDSYTLSSPHFAIHQLPEAHSEQKIPLDEGAVPLQSKNHDSEAIKHDNDNQTEKESTEDLSQEKQVISVPSDNEITMFQPQLKAQLQELIKKQKNEYIDTMSILKKKFQDEQRKFLMQLQNMNTSTPLNNVSLAPTDDEEFTEFQTCLQSVNHVDSEITLTNNQEARDKARDKAATIINAHVRGFLVRRLINTLYVQECIRNIRDTLQFVLTLSDKNSTSIHESFKIKLFQQLQGDLFRLHDIFFKNSTRDRMDLIASDRERRRKKLAQENNDHLSTSFQEI